MSKIAIEERTTDKTLIVTARRGETRFIAECEELGVFTQGETWEELETNIREAVELSLDDMGISDDDVKILVSFEEYL